MKLCLDQIRDITRGCVSVTEEEGCFRFYRFTKEQTAAYFDAGKQDFYKKTFASAGVRFAFRSNSGTFSFKVRTASGSSRKFVYFDCYENGVLTSHLGGDEMNAGEYSINFPLRPGEKDVEIYFPWTVRTDLCDVTLDDGATFLPLRRKHTMISFGDSITHGYDARYPSLAYAPAVARMLDADSVNKGIGGDIFFPELLEKPDPVSPDYVTVAYGTNDWWLSTREELEAHCRAFYVRLCELYPRAKIFAISPIWRKSGEQKTKFGEPVARVDDMMRKLTADLPQVTVINGFALVPHEPGFFSPDVVHPVDLGFCLYAENLAREIQKHL